MLTDKLDDAKGKYMCNMVICCCHHCNNMLIGLKVTCIIKYHQMFSALIFAADYSFCVHQNKIFLKKNCTFTHELLQDSEDEEPFTCNFVGFCPIQSPEEFFHPKPNPTGKDLDNVIFKTIYEPESLVTGYCSHKCIYCGLSISDDELKRNSVAESTSGKMEPSLKSDCGDNNESNLEKLDCQSYHLMEFSNSDLSDTESDNESCNSNSSLSMNLTSKVIANLSLPKEDLPYLLGCKVLLKCLSIVSIIPGDNVTHES